MDMPISERPREKLLQLGPSALTDAELLAIFLRTGTKKVSVIHLAHQIIDHFGSLRGLLVAQPHEISQFPGLGKAKTTQLLATLEMSKRYLREYPTCKKRLTTSNATKNYIALEICHLTYETFACLFLDAQNQIIAFERLFNGSTIESHVYISTVVKRALYYNAVHLICAHNHPSGSTTPSQADLKLTQQLKAALSLVDIKLIDHVIVGKGSTYSMAENSLV